MNFTKLFFRKKPIKILLALLVAGILLIVLPYLISAEQCPSNYTQQQINTSNCIVGADIGSGMIWLFGILVTSIALIGMWVTLIATIPSKITKLALSLVLIGIFLLIAGIATAPAVLISGITLSLYSILKHRPV